MSDIQSIPAARSMHDALRVWDDMIERLAVVMAAEDGQAFHALPEHQKTSDLSKAMWIADIAVKAGYTLVPRAILRDLVDCQAMHGAFGVGSAPFSRDDKAGAPA